MRIATIFLLIILLGAGIFSIKYNLYIEYLILVIIIVLLISYGISDKIIQPPRKATVFTPLDLGIVYNDIKYSTIDDITIRGWFIPASNSVKNINNCITIILAHGYYQNKADMKEYIKFLYIRGFNILSFDFRGHGDSEGRFTTIGANEPRDIDGAVEWLNINYPEASKKIGLLGISMGGAISILATANNKKIDAVVADSAFSTLSNVIDSCFRTFVRLPIFPFSHLVNMFSQWRTKANISDVLPVKYIHNIAPRPILLIHSKVDTAIPYHENAIPLYEAAKEPKYLWLVEGGEHIENYLFVGEKYEDEINRFFEDNLSIKV